MERPCLSWPKEKFSKWSAYDYQCLKSADKGVCSVLMSAAVVNDLIYSVLLVSHAHLSIITSINYCSDCVCNHIQLCVLWERWMQGVLKSSRWWICGEATRLPLLWLVSTKQRNLYTLVINNILALTINKMATSDIGFWPVLMVKLFELLWIMSRVMYFKHSSWLVVFSDGSSC